MAAKKLPDNERHTVVAFSVYPDQLAAARARALDEEKSFSAFVRDALAAYLAKEAHTAA